MSEPVAPTTGGAQSMDVGRLIAGRYRLGAQLGVGGMATVHRADDLDTGREVAVKLLRRDVLDDADIAMRFRREALAATVLRHPNIVACLETGTDDGQPFLVMELVEGEDLAARLRRAGPLAIHDVLRMAIDVARALGVAHLRGIVHRDVKPGNILLARDGRAIVTDFGIARLAADAEGAVPGTTLGSVQYFSPEQAQGLATSAASDVYGLGLVLFEALTGRRTWSADSTTALANVRIGAPAPSPRAIRPDTPADLDAVVIRALDPDPAARYPSGGAMAAAIEAIPAVVDPAGSTTVVRGAPPAAATSAPAQSPPARGPSGPAPPAPVRPPATARPSRAARRGRRALRGRPPGVLVAPLLVLACVTAVVGAGLGLATLPHKGSDADLLAVASASPTPSRRPTPKPTARPTPTASPTPAPTAKPAATSAPAAPAGAPDLCQPFFGIACGLDAGRYAPATFVPPIRFDLKTGWSTAAQDADLLVLSRSAGQLTFAGALDAVYPSGDPETPPSSAKGLVETFIVTDGVASSNPAQQKVDKRTATVVDLWPSGTRRLPLFSVGSTIVWLDARSPSRLVVIDGKRGPLLVVAQAANGQAIQSLWPAVQPVLTSLHFR